MSEKKHVYFKTCLYLLRSMYIKVNLTSKPQQTAPLWDHAITFEILYTLYSILPVAYIYYVVVVDHHFRIKDTTYQKLEFILPRVYKQIFSKN